MPLAAQNVGIGTTSPSDKLEVKNSGRSTLRISSGSTTDTAELILSNKTQNGFGTFYTDFSIKSIREEGLFISSFSDFPSNNFQNALVIKPSGNIGLGINPVNTKLHVNGGIKIEGLNVLELRAGVAGKETNAGKIVYNGFGTNALAIVGAGTTTTNRKLYFFAEGGAIFEAPVQVNRIDILDGGAIMGGFTAVNGDFNVNGKITRGETGSANMVPVCMGYVGMFGEVVSGTGNFTVTYDAATYNKDITINGETYTDEGYITVVTNVRQFEAYNFAMTKAVNGKLRISQSIGGTTITGGSSGTTAAFHFVVYKL